MNTKMIRFLLLLLLFLQACDKVELLPITSQEIMKIVEMKKDNKAVLLNVWALWCLPCVEEFPMIVEL